MLVWKTHKEYYNINPLSTNLSSTSIYSFLIAHLQILICGTEDCILCDDHVPCHYLMINSWMELVPIYVVYFCAWFKKKTTTTKKTCFLAALFLYCAVFSLISFWNLTIYIYICTHIHLVVAVVWIYIYIFIIPPLLYIHIYTGKNLHFNKIEKKQSLFDGILMALRGLFFLNKMTEVGERKKIITLPFYKDEMFL